MSQNNDYLKNIGFQQRWADLLELRQKKMDRVHRLEKKELQKEMEVIKQKMENAPVPQVGRALGLFYDPENKIGFCTSVYLSFNTQDQQWLATETKEVLKHAWLATQSFTSEFWPQVDFSVKIEGQQDFSNITLEGQSIGLAVCLLLLSNHYNQPIPTDVTFSAAIDANGNLYPVKHLEEKIQAIQKHQKFIKKVIVAGDQKIKMNPAHLKIVHCQNLQEAVQEVWGNAFLIEQVTPKRKKLQRLYESLRYYEDLQNYQAVEQIVDKILKEGKDAKQPSSRTIYLYALGERGLQFTHESRLTEAKQYFDQVIEEFTKLKDQLDPRIPIFEIFNKYGIYLTDNYRYREAEQNFNRALQLLWRHRYPEYYQVNTKNSLAQLYAKTGRHEEAEQLLQTSIKIASQTGEYDDLARIYCYLAENQILAGNFARAEEYLDRADQSLSPGKEKQLIFNAFWRAMLYFVDNNSHKFEKFLENWQQADWFSSPQQNRLHIYMIKAWACSLLEKREWIEDVSRFFSQYQDIFTLLLLIQVDALHYLRTGQFLFYEKDKIEYLIKKARKQNAYLRKNLPARLKSREDWQKLCAAIRF